MSKNVFGRPIIFWEAPHWIRHPSGQRAIALQLRFRPFSVALCRLARVSVFSLRAPFCFSLALSARSFLVSCRVVRFLVVLPHASFHLLLVFVQSFVVVFFLAVFSSRWQFQGGVILIVT